jgi:NADPH:quinone reductase-like Zn-dependent oxidoreductase
MGIAKVNPADLIFLAELLAAGKITPVIDAHYPLDQTAEAIRYVEEKHAQGKVVITVEHGENN